MTRGSHFKSSNRLADRNRGTRGVGEACRLRQYQRPLRELPAPPFQGLHPSCPIQDTQASWLHPSRGTESAKRPGRREEGSPLRTQATCCRPTCRRPCLVSLGAQGLRWRRPSNLGLRAAETGAPFPTGASPRHPFSHFSADPVSPVAEPLAPRRGQRVERKRAGNKLHLLWFWGTGPGAIRKERMVLAPAETSPAVPRLRAQQKLGTQGRIRGLGGKPETPTAELALPQVGGIPAVSLVRCLPWRWLC